MPFTFRACPRRERHLGVATPHAFKSTPVFNGDTLPAGLRREHRSKGEQEEWLLIEWPKGEAAGIAFERLVSITMMRWRIESDYLDVKHQVGLGHFERRHFDHHATVCITAYGFLISDGAPFPLQRAVRKPTPVTYRS